MPHRWGHFCTAVLAILCVTAFTTGRAHANDEPERRLFALHWVRLGGAERCVDGIELSEQVEERAGRQIFVASREANWLVEGRVFAEAAGFGSELRLFSEDGDLLGSRQVSTDSADCRELTRDLALILAIMIDATGAPKPEARAPSKQGAGSGQSESRGRVSVFARALLALTPSTALGVGAAYALPLGPWGWLRAEAAAFLPQTSAVNGVADAQVRFRLAYAGLSYCPLQGRERAVSWSGCAGLDVGQTQSRSRGLVTQRPDQNRLLLMSELALAGAIDLTGPLALTARAALLVPLTRYDYAVSLPDGSDAQVLRAPPLASAFDLGLTLQF